MENRRNKLLTEVENFREELSRLKEENAELSRNLFEVNCKLRDSERLKGHFISNITNEIINPFASILALAENIKKLEEGQLLQAHRMAELIFEEAFHLDFQLKNIFSAAMLEAGIEEIKPARIYPDVFCNHLLDYFQSQLIKKSIRLQVGQTNEFANGKPFITDHKKLDLIIKNLISNSIKFSPDGSVVELNFIQKNDRLLIEVSDQGKGINPDDRKVIFDRFKQLDEKINSINTGHGLGLSIVQAYTEMLGGEVNLNDNQDKGVRITISIPEMQETMEWDNMEDFLLDSEASY